MPHWAEGIRRKEQVEGCDDRDDREGEAESHCQGSHGGVDCCLLIGRGDLEILYAVALWLSRRPRSRHMLEMHAMRCLRSMSEVVRAQIPSRTVL